MSWLVCVVLATTLRQTSGDVRRGNVEMLQFLAICLSGLLRDGVISCDPAEMEQRMFGVCLAVWSSGELGRLLHLLFAPISPPALLVLVSPPRCFVAVYGEQAAVLRLTL